MHAQPPIKQACAITAACQPGIIRVLCGIARANVERKAGTPWGRSDFHVLRVHRIVLIVYTVITLYHTDFQHCCTEPMHGADLLSATFSQKDSAQGIQLRYRRTMQTDRARALSHSSRGGPLRRPTQANPHLCGGPCVYLLQAPPTLSTHMPSA